jgi:phosphocarrier protein FPr
VLVGLGVDELSMAPPAIPQAKQIIRGLEDGSAHARAQTLLKLESAEAVRRQLTTGQ